MTPISSLPTDSDGRAPEWLEEVIRQATKLRFGSVQIMVHDGRVTQVERIQKTRFVPAPDVQRTENQPVSLS